MLKICAFEFKSAEIPKEISGSLQSLMREKEERRGLQGSEISFGISADSDPVLPSMLPNQF